MLTDGQMAKVLKGDVAPTLLLIHGLNTDSGLTSLPVSFEGIDDFTLDKVNAVIYIAVLTMTRPFSFLRSANVESSRPKLRLMCCDTRTK